MRDYSMLGPSFVFFILIFLLAHGDAFSSLARLHSVQSTAASVIKVNTFRTTKNVNRIPPTICNWTHCEPRTHCLHLTSSKRRSLLCDTSATTAMNMLPLWIRGGGGVDMMNAITNSPSFTSSLVSNPSNLFRTCLGTLALSTALLKFIGNYSKSPSENEKGNSNQVSTKPPSIRSLQLRFLSVFWLLRCADWLQGPYFYEVYASKIFHGIPASLTLISQLFLVGFASTALFGPYVGRAADMYGRKKGTLAFALLYSLGAASTKSSILGVLLAGRVFSGIGTSLLFSAPEAWLVGEAFKKDMHGGEGGAYLGETFGLAYAGDSIVAIIAGQLAGFAAGIRGPTGPFELSIGFLIAGAVLASVLWKENIAEKSATSSSSNSSIRDAIQVVRADPKIMLVGAVQSLFEAAMYIFVLQWPPAMSAAVTKAFGAGSATPYGAVFSCFMASCLLGSTLFGYLTKMGISTETFCSIMLSVATVAMGIAAWVSPLTSTVVAPLLTLILAFFAFEACVGMYFPSIGTLRSKYVPDSHRSVIMNLFGIPLNALVVGVFLSIKKLGVQGALSCSTGALALATLSMWKLKSVVKK